jgi:WD repeat-containing protein 89
LPLTLLIVVQLNFSPTDPHILLTGSTDGLVNVLDLRIQDEDEVVVQAFNHGSVHLAGFLNDSEIYAASHDEKVALYDVAQDRENGAATLDLGDIRPVLDCQYVSDILLKPTGGAIIGVGAQE